MLKRGSCIARQKVPGSHPSFINIISITTRLSPDETVLSNKHLEFDRKRMVSPEQKSIALKKDLVYKSLKPGQQVQDLLWVLF